MMDLHQRIVWIFQIVFTVSGGADSFTCSSHPNCNCYNQSGILFANCAYLGLQEAPSFSNDVTGIILAHNDISKFPTLLPQNIMYLDLSDNLIDKIDQKSVVNYTHLSNLSVSANSLQSIELGSFVDSKRLVHLDISMNQELTIEVLVNISRDLSYSTSIRALNLESLQCTYGVSFIIRNYHIADLKNTQLEDLNLASNRINSLELGVLSTLPKSLKHLNLANNVLSFGFYLAEFGSLENIVSLNTSFQSYFHQLEIKDFFVRCNDTRNRQICNSDRSHDHLRGKEVMQWNQLSLARRKNISIYLPPKLEVLYFHDNLYKLTLQDFTFKTVGPSSVTYLYLQNNIIYELNGPILGLDSLQYIDLSNNFCNFISDRFFDGIHNATYLDLSQNALGEVLEKDVKGIIFRNLVKLRTLNLTRNRIVRLPSAIFRNLNQLEILNLSYNSLSEFTVPLENMKQLHHLDLSNNQIQFLDEETRNTIDSLSAKKKLYVNLRRNRLLCNCEQLKFLKWMRQSKNVKFMHFDEYFCTYINSSRVNFSDIDAILQLMEKQCASYILPIVIMTSLIIVIMTTTFGRILYRYRWKLRYMYYVAREKYRDNVKRPEGTDDSSYYFDAFVSYADKDRRFVIELVKRLEKDHGLKLCIHHRDFIPGTGIADNITNAIHYSRRTVTIMTSHFLDSYWCMFELNMARMEAVYSRDGENVLFLVVLEKLAIAKLPFSFMDLIENRSYLEFPENEDNDEVSAFRSKLGATLKSRECDIRMLSLNSTPVE